MKNCVSRVLSLVCAITDFFARQTIQDAASVIIDLVPKIDRTHSVNKILDSVLKRLVGIFSEVFYEK